jgi:bifunctional non-homologous end joining protein LigD
MPAKRSPSATRKLARYRQKRDFTKTAEPVGKETRKPSRPHRLRFVVQKHAASHLHFDFRLELDGVMKSWAVPKGPSLDPGVKRLAIEVEDHPIEYSRFEGTIPEGEYGGGTVMLWDRGTYTAFPPGRPGDDEARIREGLEQGVLEFALHGKRLRGAWTLVRTRRVGSKAQWLLTKRRDAYAKPGDEIVERATTSVATGRTMDEIARAASTGGRARSHTRPIRRPHAGSTARPAGSAPARTIPPIISQLDAIEQAGGNGMIHLPGHQTLEVSNLDKVFFPDTGHTKGDLMRYYMRIAPAILPLLRDRPLVLKRSPEGIIGETFFQQKSPEHVPRGVRTTTVRTEGSRGQRRIIGGGPITLLYLVQLGCISMDPWLSRIGSLDTPDFAVLDLDPGPRTPFARIVQVALWVREVLNRLGLHGAIKTSGSRGLHIAIPLPNKTSYATAVSVAQRVATEVATAHPAEATVERSIEERPPDAVYVDYLQNAKGKSVACAYSVRAKPGATVSTPLDWGELRPDLDFREFTIESVPERLATIGDLWGLAMRRRNSLRSLREAANL